MKTFKKLAFIIIGLTLTISSLAQTIKEEISLQGTSIKVYLPVDWTYEQGEALNCNAPDGDVLLMIYPAKPENIEGTPLEFGKMVMGNMFQDFKITEKESTPESENGREVTEFEGKGSLVKDNVLNTKMYFFTYSKEYVIYIIYAADKKSFGKYEETVVNIINEIE